MIISKLMKELSDLDLRLYLFGKADSFFIGDNVYLKEKIKGIKPYTVLTLNGFTLSDDEDDTNYYLKDKSGQIYSLKCDSFYPYKGQDLKKQRIYDTAVHTITITIIAVLIIILSLNLDLMKHSYYGI